MKKEWADKWVEALRSGKYAQSTRFLKRGHGYCCLGVLCEIAGASFTPATNHPDIPDAFFATFDGGVSVHSLPSTIQNLTGVRSHNGCYRVGELSLAELNDNTETFETIADIIEREWENL